MKNKAFIISGATSCGKSSLAMELGQGHQIAIINADSLQIYKDLPILSAQPSQQQIQQVPHFLYSYLNYNDSSSVLLWLERVSDVINYSFSEGFTPVLVGGSGMYIAKLLQGINDIPQVPLDIRQKVTQLYQDIGAENFIENMVATGIKREDIRYHDKQRLIRSFEVFLHTKKGIEYWHRQPKKFIIDPEIFTHINIEIDRSVLYNQCNDRFIEMIDGGALEEVAALSKKSLNQHDLQIFKTLGYEEIKNYLDGQISKSDMIERACRKTRNYAKRQLTWFRHQLPGKVTFDDKKEALKFLKESI